MGTKTKTPRTDAFCKQLPKPKDCCHAQWQQEAVADFARQLELELACLKSRIKYGEGHDGMAWAIMNWCVNAFSLSPSTLDEAIKEDVLANNFKSK